MNTYRSIPFVRLLLPLVLGILLGSYFPLPYFSYSTVLALPVLAYYARRRGGRIHPGFSAALCLGMLGLGHFLVQFHNPLSDETHIYHTEREGVLQWRGQVVSMPVPKKSIAAEVELESIFEDGGWKPVGGKIKAYFKKDSVTERMRYGDVILARSQIEINKPPPNPKAFDYRKFLARKGISHTTFVKGNTVRILSRGNGHPILERSFALREKAVGILKKEIKTSNELAVGTALVLGYKDEMTDEVQEAYSQTGATHVLAVSGLHVGILYGAIFLVFGFLGKHRRRFAIVEGTVSLLLIWGFALVTGASPSVMRAATMFSFFVIGNLLNRNKNTYNTLAASAFLLLCARPGLLFNVGFQLSYLAVLGIVFFQPIIYRNWYVGNTFGDKVWNLMSVSLAAQWVTLPVSLFYFHQFPTYFLLSGLVVIPAAFVIMISGLGMLLTYSIPVLGLISPLFAYVLNGTLWLTNALVFGISNLPLSIIENIPMPAYGMLAGYVAIACLMLWVGGKDRRFFIAALAVLALASCIHAIQKITNLHKEQLIVYDSKTTLVDHYANGRRSTYKHPDLLQEDEGTAAHLYRLSIGYVEKNGKAIAFPGDDFIQVGGRRFFVISEAYKYPRSQRKIEVDAILIQGNPYIRFDAVFQDFDTPRIIADGSNYTSRVKLWRNLLKKENTTTELLYTKERAVVME